MGTEGSESDDDLYVTVEVTIPARQGRSYRMETGNVSLSYLYGLGLDVALKNFLDLVRSDLELGDRT